MPDLEDTICVSSAQNLVIDILYCKSIESFKIHIKVIQLRVVGLFFLQIQARVVMAHNYTNLTLKSLKFLFFAYLNSYESGHGSKLTWANKKRLTTLM